MPADNSSSSASRTAIGSMITGLQTMPSIAWFPLAILLFGLEDSAIYFVVVLGALSVVGVMISEGAKENAAWAPYVDSLTTVKGTDQMATIDWAAMLPADKLTYRYEGSLTTPPCTEGVHWFLMTAPVELSTAQIAKITAAYDGNFRPVQPLNGREVDVDTSK